MFGKRVSLTAAAPPRGRATALLALLAAALVALALAPVPLAHADTATAPGAPGSESYFDLARKDCVGTAANTSSKVWFTVAGGALSDVYWPTVDATNVHSLQYIVTDGHSFTDVQMRDMAYTVAVAPDGMSCTVTAASAVHGYRIVTDYLADPARDAVLMRVRFLGPAADSLYVRLDPLAGGTGGGGYQNAGANSAQLVQAGGQTVPVAFNANTVTNASNRTYAVPTYEALEASHGFDSASVGYADSSSDGLTMLDSRHELTRYDQAPDGHVTLTAQVRIARFRDAVLALGFGTTATNALETAAGALHGSFQATRAAYDAGWARYDARLRRPSPRLGRDADRQYFRSVNVVRASEDKTFPGAIAAGLASPWGQAVPAGNLSGGQPTYFGSYREVFARDLYEAFTALLLAGDLHSARAATLFLFDRQQLSDGSMPRNSLENGLPAPDTGGLQLDETSYPILMAWESGLAGDASLYRRHIIPAADFLVAHGPSDGVERWEEQSGYSPSTIAAEIAGLTAAAHIARGHGDAARADVYQATADQFARHIKDWTVTTTGPYGPRYFLRLSKTGDPNAAITYNLGNGSIDADQRSVIDAGFLELVRLGVLPATDPDVQATLPIVDATIGRQTPSGPGFYRYGTGQAGSEDGYGDCWTPDPTNCSPDGAPWPRLTGANPSQPGSGSPANTGSGHLWPVLSGERGEYEVAAGLSGAAGERLTDMRTMTSGGYLEPEQAWEDPALPASPFGTDPSVASIGFTPGQPAGSASPLTWAQAQYARLALDVSAGHDLDTPSITTDRYVRQGLPGSLPLTITAPASGSSVTTPAITVTGTTAPGATVAAEAVGAAGGTAAVASTTADSSGNWSLSLPSSFGSSTITVTASQGRATGYAQTVVTDVALPGTQVFSVADPRGDDNGPGTYAYPTAGQPSSPVFVPGAFDLTHFTVSQTSTDVYLQTTIAHLVNTFGSDFGAQLLDLYVRDPTAPAASTSQAPAYAAMNYHIAPADAWSERLEVQGFASPIWVDASGQSLGNPQFIVDDPSGTATLVLPRSVFGTVGPGWTFTLALTGQGAGSPPIRSFASTPQAYAFGVCASSTDPNPICSVDPGSVPTVMDTITPTPSQQGSELDPVNGPASLTGVTVP